ncbi:hypothetical protein BH11ARM2_BH11ARM2_22050 [soil metagenome]
MLELYDSVAQPCPARCDIGVKPAKPGHNDASFIMRISCDDIDR